MQVPQARPGTRYGCSAVLLWCSASLTVRFKLQFKVSFKFRLRFSFKFQLRFRLKLKFCFKVRFSAELMAPAHRSG